jgi:hypothetical protein
MNGTTTNGRVAPGAAPAGGAEWDPFVPSHFEEVRVGRTGDGAPPAGAAPGARPRPASASIVHE